MRKFIRLVGVIYEKLALQLGGWPQCALLLAIRLYWAFSSHRMVGASSPTSIGSRSSLRALISPPQA